MKFRLVSAGALIFSIAISHSASSQTAKKPPLSFGADVAVIAIPVYVIDKDGKTVAGLKVEDFELSDSGKPVPIEGFVAVSGDKPVGDVSDVAAPALRRQFLFLFDLDFSRAANVERARRAARQFAAKNLSPTDLAAVGVVSPAGFKPLVGFTTDKPQVVAAIDGLGLGGAGRDRDPLGLVYDAGLGPQMEGRSADNTSDAPKVQALAEELKDQAVQLARGNREMYSKHVVQFLGGFQALAQSLDSIKGRKQVILFSEGFDGSVLSGASSGTDRSTKAASITEGRLYEVDSEDHFGSASGQSALIELFKTLRGADVVIHAVDVNGLGDTVNLQSQEGEGSSVVGKNVLAELAQNSGGRFVRAANNIEAGLAEVMAANRDFYVLAFSPANAERGKPRKLSVKVKRPGLSVSHRATYTLPDPKKADPARAAYEGAEIIAKGVSGGPIQMHAYALPYRASDGKAAVPLVVQIPGDALLEILKRKQVGLQLYGYLVDREGAVLDYFVATPTLDPAQVGDIVRKTGIQVITNFVGAQGPLEVRLLLRDPGGTGWGALRIPVDVPDFSPAAPRFVSAAMVIDDPRGRLALPTTTKRRPNRDIPFRLDDRPITVEADPVLKRGASREMCVYLRPGGADPSSMQVELVARDGAKHAQKAEKVSVIRDADGFDRIVFFISPSGVEPGDYSLNVSLAGASSTSAVRIQ